MTIIKNFIPCNCSKIECQHFNTCDMLPTEVIKHQELNNDKIDILIFGMGSGKTESRLHVPFCGRSGKYMRSIIKHLWDTNNIFNLAISNNVRCHPMDENKKDREPTPEEISMCISFLIQDIITLDPKVIIPVGRNASRTFLTFSEDTSMGKMRGTHKAFIGGKERIIIPTYHPSFLTRNYGTFKPEDNNLYDRYFITDILEGLGY